MQFSVRRTIGKLWIMMAGFAIFIPIGLVLTRVDRTAGLAMALFGALPQVFFIYSALAPQARYNVSSGQLVLSRVISKLSIPLASIASVEVLSEEEANEVLRAFMAPAIQGERDLDLKAWIQSNRTYGELLRYCTVPVLQHRRTSGNWRNIVSFGASTSGDLVLVRHADRAVLLSPADPDAFVSRLRKEPGISGDASPASLVPGTAKDPARAARLKSLWRTYRIVSFALVLAVAVIAFLLLR